MSNRLYSEPKVNFETKTSGNEGLFRSFHKLLVSTYTCFVKPFYFGNKIEVSIPKREVLSDKTREHYNERIFSESQSEEMRLKISRAKYEEKKGNNPLSEK